ncbi:hypothetical protein [Kitasatospora sp. MBT66]|uniref:hypothetical protein n=1 Tax=Kitasatospora sp. MBT66 TaxID=1444769 RepID=UPI0005BCB52A|nr:hypothetical protein [Kitasatospora sp. MBT66]
MADAYTNRRDWENSVRVWSGLANVQPGKPYTVRSPERETTVDRLLVYLPPRADVDSADRITVRGVVYQIEDEPAVWKAGVLSHITVKAVRVRR